MLYLFLNGHGGDILQNYILNLSEREKKKIIYTYIYDTQKYLEKLHASVCVCLYLWLLSSRTRDFVMMFSSCLGAKCQYSCATAITT